MNKELLMRSQNNTAVLEAEEDFETAGAPRVKTEKAAQDRSAPHVHCGYGACSISGCYCQSYSGQGYTCANCGHNYASHW